jgi:hypothetical protein
MAHPLLHRVLIYVKQRLTLRYHLFFDPLALLLSKTEWLYFSS